MQTRNECNRRCGEVCSAGVCVFLGLVVGLTRGRRGDERRGRGKWGAERWGGKFGPTGGSLPVLDLLIWGACLEAGKRVAVSPCLAHRSAVCYWLLRQILGDDGGGTTDKLGLLPGGGFSLLSSPVTSFFVPSFLWWVAAQDHPLIACLSSPLDH